MAVSIEYKNTNTQTLYAACCGLTIWDIYRTREEAEAATVVPEGEEDRYYSHSSQGSKNYNFPYVMEIEPGVLKRSVFCADMATIEQEFGGQAFNYVRCEGLIPKRITTKTAAGEKVWRKEF